MAFPHPVSLPTVPFGTLVKMAFMLAKLEKEGDEIALDAVMFELHERVPSGVYVTLCEDLKGVSNA